MTTFDREFEGNAHLLYKKKSGRSTRNPILSFLVGTRMKILVLIDKSLTPLHIKTNYNIMYCPT